jgi:flagellar hook-associated protein 1 FlgK
MPSTFFGIEIGTRALMTNQLALQVIGQNTANVNTEGYSRQVVQFDQTDPYTLPDYPHAQPGMLGTGVTIAAINRIRDAFIDRRVFAANSWQGAIGNLRDILGRVEEAYNEPSDTGIGQLMTNLFNSFADLSANPESGAIRSTVRNNAETLIAAIRSVDAAMTQINPEIQAKIAVKVGDVNSLAGQIAELNKQIRLSIAAGDHPNDLLDKRGVLLDTLSSLVDIQVTESSNSATGKPTGEVQINVGGYALVQGDTANALPTTMTTANGNLGLVTAEGNTIPLRGGELYGLVKATTLLASYHDDLNTLVGNLITAVNTQHSLGVGLDGVTGRPFFTGTDAASINLNPVIKSDLNVIAAAAAPTPPTPFATGNGDNARALAALTSRPVIAGFSLSEFYNSSVGRVGADSRSFIAEADNQDKVVNQLKNQQQAVSGVSLDEELTHMLQYQRSYQAATRIINVMDDVLNRIINGLGAGSAVGG